VRSLVNAKECFALVQDARRKKDEKEEQRRLALHIDIYVSFTWGIKSLKQTIEKTN